MIKQFLLITTVAFAFGASAMGQQKATPVSDTATVTTVRTTGQTDEGIEYTDVVGSSLGNDVADESSSARSGNGNFLNGLENMSESFNEGILVAIVAIIAVFGLPVFIIFFAFYFRYKSQKARYRVAEQALAAGQPLPTEFIKEYQTKDVSSQGIKNTFTGIGLFIFLWAITGNWGIGSIGLLVMFMGIGQWIIGLNRPSNRNNQQAPPPPSSTKEQEREKE